MSPARLRFLAAAVAEAEKAAAWYGERSQDAREAFLHELEHAFRLIAEGPERWPQYRHRTRRLVLKRFPFSVIYRLVGGDPQIIAIAHDKQRPGYWRRR
ncbi:MAG TPA: type II toxin-antitoxin system RelE/ParE family toxin [Thermoanaerobaculia bacterium]|nr:type II toxin-antitoxin system RelE/ParE family toxin [Thermoanaerobaculia bacterium]